MKGSLKIKFDLGWVFSATFAVFLVIFMVARATVSVEIQSNLRDSCIFLVNDYIKTQKEYYPESNTDPKPLINQCVVEYKKPFLKVVTDTNSWRFRDAYPNLYLIYTDTKKTQDIEKRLAQ